MNQWGNYKMEPTSKNKKFKINQILLFMGFNNNKKKG